MQDNTKKTLLTFLRFSSKYKKTGIFLSLLIVFASITNSIIPIFYKNFFNFLAQNESKNIIVKNLVSTLIIIFIFLFFRWLFWRIASFLTADFKSKIITDLGNHCFSYIHKHSFSYFNDTFTGSLVKRIKSYTRSFEVIADQIIFELLPLISNIGVIIIVLFFSNYLLAVGIIVWIFIFLSVIWVFTKYKLKYDLQRNVFETQNTSLLADTITNHANVKLFNGYKSEVKRYIKSNHDFRKILKLTWNLSNTFEAVQAFFTLILEVGVFFFAIQLWQQNKLTIGDFVLVQTYLVTIYTQLWGFGRVLRRIYESLADAEEMTVILNSPHEINDVSNAKKLHVQKSQIDFKNIDFSYIKGHQVINRFTLNIKPKEKIALIGPSGAGKTTIIKLLLRLHNLSKGQILIDGQDVKSVTQESLRQNISLVPQDPILFHRTLMENIRYGRPNASDKEVISAAKAAHCHEFIIKFPDGYSTYTGERGVKLSGGERQRIAIARAILRNAPILIFDEATSNLDSESESLIQDALLFLMKNKTVIFIAHRLSTIRKVDRIIVINKGEIVEEGTHDQLITKDNSLYHRLWQIQAGGFNV